jgi:murein DD-endopeptidase MepM/ murein hydrolase activator NlpD
MFDRSNSFLVWLRSVLAACLIFSLLTLAIPALAEPSVDELRQQQQQIQQQRSTLNDQRDRLQTQEKSAQQTLGGLRNRIKATAAEITATERKLKAANQKLEQVKAALAKAEQHYQEMQGAMVARLRFLQRQQVGYGWSVLLESRSFNEFLDRRYQLRRVYQADRQLLQDLRTQADEIEQRRTTVEEQKNQITLLRQQFLAQKAEFEAQAQEQQENINRLRRDRKALEAAEAQLTKDSDSIADLIQQRLAEQARRQGIPSVGNGQLSIPCDAPLTSGFGPRVHPILGYSRFHSGIDFGADYGTPIRAAEAGVVIFAGWYGGYGQTVIIDHGNAMSTLYAHSSELYVTEGEPVQRDQVIAAVGSTGLSTGPHLHFEVRFSGEPVDPMEYL